MGNRLSIISKIFIRSKELIISGVCLFAAEMVLLGRLIFSDEMNGELLLVILSRGLLFSVIAFAYFLFVSYELGSKAHKSNCTEILSAIPGEAVAWDFAQLIVLIVPAVVWSTAVYMWQIIAYSITHINVKGYLTHSFLAVLLYSFLPEIIAILLGMVISTIQKRAAAYLLIVLLSFLTSFLPLRFFSVQINGVSIAGFLDWFALAPPDSQWAPDFFYGIPMEAARWVLCLFWISFGLFMLLFRYRRLLLAKQKILLVMAVCLTLLSSGRFALRGEDSIICKDERPNSILTCRYKYYRNNQVAEEKPADFRIEKYDMTIRISGKLKAAVSMQLSMNGDADSLIFTLYHGLHVKSVQDADGCKIPFIQEGDYLIVYGRPVNLTIRYQGNLDKYYSNYQGVFLPEYTAYYPLAGTVSLYNTKPVPVCSQPEAEYDVHVRYRGKILSNLSRVDDNHFRGASMGLGLYAGLIQENEKDGIHYVESRLAPYSENFDRKMFEQEWMAYQEYFGLEDTNPFADKLVVFQPMTVLAVNADVDSFVLTDKSVFFGDLVPQSDVLCIKQLMKSLKRNKNTFWLYDWFEWQLYGGLHFMHDYSAEKPDYEKLEILKSNRSDLPKEKKIEWGQGENLANELLEYQLCTLGDQYVMNRIFDYLRMEAQEQFWLDFVYELEVAND